MTESDFAPSALGTKEHWVEVYNRELKSFQESGDEGEIWFGEGSMTRVVHWLNTQQLPLHTPILDIGTGNGMLLVELAKQGFTNLTGIDYCSSAIELARSICEKEDVSESVHLEVTDFLTTFSASERFDVCLDKGTFDAVSLDPDGAAEMQRQYVQALCRVIRPEGLFIITSCNWTKQELVGQFGDEFEVVHELPTPTFHFGGHAGKSVTALAFRKKSNRVESRIRDEHPNRLTLKRVMDRSWQRQSAIGVMANLATPDVSELHVP